MRRVCFVVLVMAGLVLVPDRANAQHSMYLVPVEEGFLSTHVELQLHYSNLGLGGGGSLNLVILGIEAQYAIANRFELGVNLPLLVYGNAYGSAGRYTEEAQVGDILVNLKLRLAGTRKYAVSLFTNGRIPTHSANYSRDYGVLRGGVAASGAIDGAMFGGSLFTMWYILGGSEDVGLVGFDLHGGYTLFKMLTLELAFQFINSVTPDNSLSPLCLIPGISFQPLRWLRLGLATRIALNDSAKYFYSGRASLLFNLGFTF